MAEASVIKLILETTSAKTTLASFKSDMRSLETNIGSAETKFKNLGSSGVSAMGGIKTAIAGVIGALGLGAIATGVTDTIREFEKLQASLKTVTGSAEAGAAAFDMIQKFTATTPFELQEVTKAFTILKRSGLDVTTKSLTDFGNIAAANGKSIEQFAEAVADGLTGEFERLKEFGIKASKDGDNVRMTFQNQTTTIKNNAAAIEEYLRKIGQTTYGSGIADQAKTINGAISNVKDNLAMFAYWIGEGGLKTALYDLSMDFVTLTGSSEELARTIGEYLGNGIQMIRDAFASLKPYAEEIKAVLVGIGSTAVVAGIVALGAAAASAAISLAAMAAAFIATPIGAVAAAIGAAAGALYYYRDAVVQVGSTQATVWEVAQGTYDMLKVKITEFAQQTWATLTEWGTGVSELFGFTWKDAGEFALDAGNTVINLMTTTYDVIKIVLTNIKDVFLSTFSGIGSAATVFFTGLWEAISTQSTAPLEGMAQKMANAFTTSFGAVGEQISAAINNGMAKTPIQDAVKAATEGAKGALDSYKSSVEQYVIARQRQNQLDELIAAAHQAERDALIQKGQAQLSATQQKKQEEEADKAAAQAKKSFVDSLRDEIWTMQQKIATVGMDQTATENFLLGAKAEKFAVDDKTRAQVEYLKSLNDTFEAKQREADFTKYIENLKEETRILGLNKQEREAQMKILQANRQFNNELSAEQKILLEDTIRQNEQARVAAEARDKIEQDASNKVLERQRKEQYEYKRTAEVAGDAAEDIAKSLYDVAAFGTNYLPQLFRSMISGIGQIMKAAFSGTSGGFFSEFFSGMGSSFGGYRASGGPVSAGTAYVVGEKRPELFVPKTDGYIIPQVPTAANSNVAGNGDFKLSVSIENVHTTGAEVDENTVREIAVGVMQVAKKMMVNERRYGGVLA